MRDLELPIPPIGEQREIVAEIEKQFSRLDEAVANLQRVKANLKRYKASVLKAAVEGRLVETEATLARREGRSRKTYWPSRLSHVNPEILKKFIQINHLLSHGCKKLDS